VDVLAKERERQEAEEQKFYEKRAQELKSIALDDLSIVCVLGKGSFGLVKLVQHKDSKKAYALKVLQKQHMVAAKQANNVIWEKRIMHRIVHPFCLKLCATMVDDDALYLLMEFLQGGDLFIKLCYEYGHFDQRTSKYYAACVLSAFSYLHAKSILYRDLKPENLVLDKLGTLKVVDFGMAKITKNRTFTVCGTPEYMSPEIVTGKGHHKGADYWALGVLAYELLNGVTPFAVAPGAPPLKVYKKINRAKIKFPEGQDEEMPDAVAFILFLLNKLEIKRGGCTEEGDAVLKSHAWFTGTHADAGPIDFSRLEALEIVPPIKPDVEGDFDASNFDDWGDEPEEIKAYEPSGAEWEAVWETEF
jgi:serine/threonine protein kinase